MLKRATPMRSLIAAVIAGFIAGAIHPGDNKAGFIITSLLGISGSLLILFVYNKLSGKPAA